MSNKDLIKIKFENNEYEISIPSDIEDLKKNFLKNLMLMKIVNMIFLLN